MSTWVPIRYRDFYDIPHIFVVRYLDRIYLFDGPFDASKDDYADCFQVYLMPDLSESDLSGDWSSLPSRAECHLGSVPVSEVTFDKTRRRAIDVEVLQGLLIK